MRHAVVKQLADAALGQTPIENGVFFTRLGQRIIHILSTRMMNGLLYEVDMRLRPSGNSGLLVASLKSFQRYQERDAWTWEHQALTRARVVAGSSIVSATVCPQCVRRCWVVSAM
jgi:glutamate-ammonia-ligase adenylyltransferase